MSEWQPIETAPEGKLLILWAMTSTDPENWKMAIGSKHNGEWNWGDRWLKPYEVKPTHWMPLPSPPQR